MSDRSRQSATSVAILACGLAVGVVTLGFAPVAVVPAAGAATCTTSGGVSVVVDYRELGGSTVTACSPDGGGKSAAAIFASVGVSLSYATRQPGFVCRVNDAPASDPCVNASPSNAYWGLWWADGSTASWRYSSYGVGALTVPSGGSVGWSWQQDRTAGTIVPPGVAPPVSPASTPTASPSPTSSPTASPTGGGNATTQPSGTAGPSPSPTPSDGPTGGSRSSGGGVSPTANPTSGMPSPSAGATLDSESPSDSRRRGDSGDGPVASESPLDSRATESSPSVETAAEQPRRIPTAVTWSIVGLLAIAIAGSAVMARRRRGL